MKILGLVESYHSKIPALLVRCTFDVRLTYCLRVLFILQVPLLTDLTEAQRESVVDIMKCEEYSNGEYIIRQGEKGDAFYLLLEGEAKATKSSWCVGTDGAATHSAPQEVMQYSAGGYFGEIALLLDCPRKANVLAMGDCKV